MSTFSDEMDALALELLIEFGEAVTFTHTTQGTYDVSTASISGSTSTFSGYAAPVNYTPREVNGEMILQSDIKLYVNAVSTEPVPGDKVTVSGKTYRVVSVLKNVINSNTVLYEVQVRV